ncbi:MAG: hypothetical protein RJA63_1466 [Pseudomonadota bacterium]|jgi:branched-chain amino acid transport system permease protein
MDLINQLLQGVLVGSLYALLAYGLSLSVGIIRLVNLAHGDFIVLGAFLCVALATGLGLHPFWTVLATVPVCFAGGYLLQRGLLGRVRGADSLAPLLMTFAISIIVQNLLLESFGADGRRASGGELETMTLPVGQSINLGVLPLITLAVAVAMAFALDRLLYGTSLGARLRAVSDDPGAADLIGMSTARTCAMAMGLVGVTVAVGATFFSMSSFFAPTSGPSSLLIAFEVVVLGGLGSLWGTLIGGIVIGVAQSIGGQFDVAWQTLAGHLAFLVLFMLRPQGLFPRA